MILPKEQIALEEGEEFRGRFWIAGRPETEVSGVLHWSNSDGAQLWLIGPFHGWPGAGFSSGFSESPITVHGVSARNGKKITLPEGLITHSTFGSGSQLKLVDHRLILFEHLEPTDLWKRFTVRTASLHEWLPITGFESNAEFDERFRFQKYTVNWEAPRGKRVQLKDAELRFGSRMTTDLGPWQPDRLIRTALDVTVYAKSPDTLDFLYQRFAIPLLDLLILATGRPDRFTYQALFRGSRTRAVVLHRQADVEARDTWQPWRPPLFYARQLPEFRPAIKKWFHLHARVSPAIEVFTDSINQGSVYSPGRLLSVASALETYHRVLYESHWKRRWRRQNPGKKTPTPSLLQRVEHLQRIAAVPAATTGMSKANRELFVSSRNHFAHLSAPRYGYSTQDVYDNSLPTIRRGVALMQACLLRKLGFSGRATSERLAEHYRNWAVPT